MFLYHLLIGWLKPFVRLLYRRAFHVAAFIRHSVAEGRAPIIGLPASLMDTDLYKVRIPLDIFVLVVN